MIFSCITPSLAQNYEEYYKRSQDSIENYNFSAGYFYANECVKMEPKRDSSFTLRAYASSALWNHSEAYTDAKRALSINPQNAYAHYICGMANVYIPIPQKEQDSILNIFRLFGKDSTSSILLNYKIPQGPTENSFYNYRKSFNHFAKAYLLDSTFYECLYLIGNYYSELNHKDSALKYIDRTIMLNPTESKYYLTRGLIYKESYQSQLSLSDFNKAINLDATNGLAYSNRAFLKKEQLNDQEGACEDLKRAQLLGYFDTNYYIECE